jgi:hypothetical protein
MLVTLRPHCPHDRCWPDPACERLAHRQSCSASLQAARPLARWLPCCSGCPGQLGNLGPAPISPRRGTAVQRLPCLPLSMPMGWTGMLRLAARRRRAAEATARGPGCLSAAATIARRAGAINLVEPHLVGRQKHRAGRCVPAAADWPTGRPCTRAQGSVCPARQPCSRAEGSA